MASITESAKGALPCPFCGARDDDLICEGDEVAHGWGVECLNDDCNASGPRGAETPEQAVAKWNDR